MDNLIVFVDEDNAVHIERFENAEIQPTEHNGPHRFQVNGYFLERSAFLDFVSRLPDSTRHRVRELMQQVGVEQ